MTLLKNESVLALVTLAKIVHRSSMIQIGRSERDGSKCDVSLLRLQRDAYMAEARMEKFK